MSEKKHIPGNNLKELRASGFEIVDGEPDIRGWKVRTIQNEEIGKVDELLFDTVSLKVRYLVVDLDGKPLNLISRDILIPIGLAELDDKNNIVVFPEVTVGHLASLPEYKRGKVTIETERAIRAVFVPVQNSGINPDTYRDQVFDDPDEFYNHAHFDEERMYRSHKTLSQGEDPIKYHGQYTNQTKRIVPATPERENIEQRRVEEERKTDVKPQQEGSFAPFQEGAIEIKEHSEIPFVSKEARVVEEISLNKEVKEHKEKVKDSVRRTEVDIEKLKKDDLRGD